MLEQFPAQNKIVQAYASAIHVSKVQYLLRVRREKDQITSNPQWRSVGIGI